jgi:hypothetical protein
VKDLANHRVRVTRPLVQVITLAAPVDNEHLAFKFLLISPPDHYRLFLFIPVLCIRALDHRHNGSLSRCFGPGRPREEA